MDLNSINANINRLLTNIWTVISFLKEFAVDGAKDVSITYINSDGSESVKTFPNISKMWETFNITNDGGVIKDLDGNILAYGGDSGWQDLKPFLTNGWVEYSTAYALRYRKIGNVVFLEGLVKDGTESNVLILPTGLRPTKTIYFSTAGCRNSNVTDDHKALEISSTGNVNPITYSTDWTSIQCMYFLN